ncbi:TPA: 30S ribosomal protein S19 [Candidatus Woesearchaeota archaeon]|nr:30S ribosomal protein S19 [uncultured archaeon]MBS3173424.1 30S ribosomal protein S19 [Candidatus Woesearchaeota archaeon]HIH31484.1 30S ribosomal protein S19 [Candidatus Woesearchaeota archaeon]HIH54161.1 30S ribosomal protein S19 [Candidatus Woesearchaeota archaeon]HIJ01105.1 30S ribosomal protein S19 [Candidatus Woesearchaeota archaeon]
MAKKIFTYRGKTIDELKKYSLKELAELLPSRQRRSIARGFNDEKQKIMKKLQSRDSIETHVRDMIVLPDFVGKTIKVHNGKEFTPVIIQEDMVGMFFGELAMTRKKVTHNSPGVGATKSSSNTGNK